VIPPLLQPPPRRQLSSSFPLLSGAGARSQAALGLRELSTRIAELAVLSGERQNSQCPVNADAIGERKKVVLFSGH
jgi:hypothetical protein